MPSYNQVLARVADALDGDVGRRLGKAWARRRFKIFYDGRPLLLLAALRHDALAVGPAHTSCGPRWPRPIRPRSPQPPRQSRVGWGANPSARPGLARPSPAGRWQTNEVSRAVAWLWPALLAPGNRPAGRRPELALVNLGCSAGLNLVADALDLTWTNPEGAPFAVARTPRVVRRLGLEQVPLNPCRDDDADWLRACVWAGERNRLGPAGAGHGRPGAARRTRIPAPVSSRRLPPAIPARLTALAQTAPGDADADGPLWLAYQTVVREYLEPDRTPYLNGTAWVHRVLASGPGAVDES